MPWLHLAIAGLLEVAWAIGLKTTHGFTRPVPSLLTVVAMVASFYFLAQALRVLPVGTAYAVWTGIGACGTTTLGILLYGESAAPARLVSIALIVTGILGLRFTSSS